MKVLVPAASGFCPLAVLRYLLPYLVQLGPPMGFGLSLQMGAGLWLTETEHAEHHPAWQKAFCSLSPASTPQQWHGAQGPRPDPGRYWADVPGAQLFAELPCQAEGRI